MSTDNNSFGRLVDSSTESATLMNNLVKELDQLVSSDVLADLPEVRNQLTAARDQLDVAAIALYTDIEAATSDEHQDVTVAEAVVTETTNDDTNRETVSVGTKSERPDLKVLHGGADQAVASGNQAQSTQVASESPSPLIAASGSQTQPQIEQVGAKYERSVSLPPLQEPVIRRSIEIPKAVANDADATARFVVNQPNVVLLVDGDSVAGLGWPSFPVGEQRAALITYLSELSSSSGCAPDVVLDGRKGPQGTNHDTDVRLRLTKAPTAPVQALDELIDAYPTKWTVAVVTDGKELVASAALRNVTVLTARQLLNLFIPT